jgi:hypothetical protein
MFPEWFQSLERELQDVLGFNSTQWLDMTSQRAGSRGRGGGSRGGESGEQPEYEVGSDEDLCRDDEAEDASAQVAPYSFICFFFKFR